MNIQDAIFGRRSTRRFTEYQVTDAELQQLLDAARFAPSWANTQVWEFVVVRDREQIAKIVETYSSTNPARTGSLAASALIVACARLGVSGVKGDEQTTKFSEWFLFDLGCACQNIALMAHALGLGTVVVGLLDHDRCKSVVALPDGYEAVAVLPIGKPAKVSNAPGRRPIAECVSLDHFRNPYPASGEK